MSLSVELMEALKVTAAYAGSENASYVEIPNVLASVYAKLKDLASKEKQ